MATPGWYSLYTTPKIAPTCAYIAQEAIETLSRVYEDFAVDHVRIETSRLFAAIVKYCQSQSKLLCSCCYKVEFWEGILLQIIRKGGYKWVYHLLESGQSQLVGEGLIAINVIAAVDGTVLLHLFMQYGMLYFVDQVLLSLLNEANPSILDRIYSILVSSSSLNLINNSLVLVKTLIDKDLGNY